MGFYIRKMRGYAWIVVLLSAFLLFYKYIMQVFPGLIADEIMSSFKLSAGGAGALVAVTFWTIVIVQLFSGLILDKFGFRIISAVSILISALGLLLFIYAADHSELSLGYIARIMIGAGVAFATVSYIKAVSVWFSPQKFAFVTSFLASAAMLGAIFGQAPLSFLMTHSGSWQKGLEICAFIGIIGAVVYFVIVRDNNPHSSYQFETSHFSWQAIRHTFLNKNNWLLTLYSGLSFTAIDAFAGLWGNNYFREQYQISTEHAAAMISMIFIGLAIGSPVLGKLSEKLDTRKPVMLVFHMIATISLAVVLSVKTTPFAASICLFIFGFCLGTFMLAFAIGRNINSVAVAATVAAFINTGEPILGALFDPLIGYFLDLNWKGGYVDAKDAVVTYAQNAVPEDAVKHFSINSYHIAFSLLTLSMIAAFVLLCFVKDKAHDQTAKDLM